MTDGIARKLGITRSRGQDWSGSSSGGSTPRTEKASELTVLADAVAAQHCITRVDLIGELLKELKLRPSKKARTKANAVP